jgi:hypothetical protein
MSARPLRRNGGALLTRGLTRDRAPLPALALLFAAALLAERGAFGERVRRLVDDVRDDGPNDADSDLLARDYYRGLLGEVPEFRDGRLHDFAKWLLYGNARQVWPERFFETEISRASEGFPLRELVPGRRIEHRGVVVETNAFGMRDDPCAQTPPAGTLRLALVGASNDMGWGVPHEACYEARLEQALRERLAPDGGARCEVLNLSLPGYTILEHLWAVEERVPAFEPRLVLVSVTLPDLRTQAVERLASRVLAGRDLHYGFVREIVAKSGAARGDSLIEACRKLRPYGPALYRGAFEGLARAASERGLRVAALVLKLEGGERVHPSLRWAADAAEAAGLPALRVFDAYRGLTAREACLDVRVDRHPTPTAHAALAAELLEDLLAHPTLASLFEHAGSR